MADESLQSSLQQRDLGWKRSLLGGSISISVGRLASVHDIARSPETRLHCLTILGDMSLHKAEDLGGHVETRHHVVGNVASAKIR